MDSLTNDLAKAEQVGNPSNTPSTPMPDFVKDDELVEDYLRILVSDPKRVEFEDNSGTRTEYLITVRMIF